MNKSQKSGKSVAHNGFFFQIPFQKSHFKWMNNWNPSFDWSTSCVSSGSWNPCRLLKACVILNVRIIVSAKIVQLKPASRECFLVNHLILWKMKLFHLQFQVDAVFRVRMCTWQEFAIIRFGICLVWAKKYFLFCRCRRLDASPEQQVSKKWERFAWSFRKIPLNIVFH